MMGHSKEVVAALPRQLDEAYLYFQHLPHYPISSTSLIQNMIPEITEEDLKKLKQPTALILGTGDNFLSKEKGEKIAAAMPNGEFYAIKNSGHLPWLENPERVAQIILR
jgi:pimeloyl-ACP methyl ester carboxylesterase